MQQQNIPIGTLVDMYKRGEMRLPEIQRHYVWRATRVRDLLDSLYRGYPSGSILMWETDEPVPTRDFAIAQDSNAFAGRKLLLDGQQRLTSLTAVLNGEPVSVRGRKRPIDILFNLEHEEVTDIFVRVNSLGAKLRSSDLALAQMTSRWQNLLKQLEGFQAECEESWFTIDLGQLVRGIVVFATQQCLFRSVSATPVEKLKKGWEEAKEGMRFAINFLRTNAGIEDESLLSSPMFIHVLAAVSRVKDNRLTAAEQRALLHWLLVANARGRYSRGSTESLLNEDLAIVFRSGDVAALIEPVKRQFGRLHVEPGDLAGRGVNSPLFSLAYLALKASGAKDWHSGLGLSLTHQGKLHFIQWHHIIPKSLLKAHAYETGEINEIANMAFITGQANRRISNKEAKVYLADIVTRQGEETLISQCVPTDTMLWDTARYRDFLTLRREQLAERMNAFIKQKAGM